MMTCNVITYTGPMSRWAPDASERLERAAIDLFDERGFDAVTVPEIAARAGLTTRTFFRHFADKREVLFGFEAGMTSTVSEMMSGLPATMDPLEVLERGFARLAPVFVADLCQHLRRRQAIIDSHDGLRERELRKFALLSEAIESEFLQRGLEPISARLVAETATAVFKISIERWIRADNADLGALFRETLRSLSLLAPAR